MRSYPRNMDCISADYVRRKSTLPPGGDFKGIFVTRGSFVTQNVLSSWASVSFIIRIVVTFSLVSPDWSSTSDLRDSQPAWKWNCYSIAVTAVCMRLRLGPLARFDSKKASAVIEYVCACLDLDCDRKSSLAPSLSKCKACHCLLMSAWEMKVPDLTGWKNEMIKPFSHKTARYILGSSSLIADRRRLLWFRVNEGNAFA